MQTLFGKYLRKSPPKDSEVYELKICKGTSLPLDSVQQNQIDALCQSERGSFYHKLTDPPVFTGMNTRFNLRRPFDCMCLVNVKAFVVVWFYRARQIKVFYKIPIEEFLRVKKALIGKRKSLTLDMVQKMGEPIFITIK